MVTPEQVIHTVGTPTCHSISYSIPFHLQHSFLCPYTNQHTDLANSILTTTGNHSLTPSFSVYFQTKEMAPGKRNYTQQATPTSSANQPVAEQADQQATCIKGAHLTNEKQFIRKGVTVNNTPRRKLGKTGGMTARPRCLVDRAHHRSSGTSSSSPSEPVAAASIPPRTYGQSTA